MVIGSYYKFAIINTSHHRQPSLFSGPWWKRKFHCSTFQKHALALQLATLMSVPSVFSEQEDRMPSDHQHQSMLPLSAAGHTVLIAGRYDLN